MPVFLRWPEVGVGISSIVQGGNTITGAWTDLVVLLVALPPHCWPR